MHNLFLIGLIVLLTWGCTSKNDAQRQAIKEMEQRLNEKFSPVTADSLAQSYIAYVSSHPDDTLSPRYLYNAARMFVNLNNGSQALTYFAQFRTQYPEHSRASDALFMLGFVQETLLQNLEAAKQHYQEFIRLYPGHNLADDAQASIALIDIPLEELVKQFEAKQDSTIH